MRLLCFCITLGAILANSVCFGDVPPELKAVVEYQKKNKNAVVNSIQQEALRLKRAGDAEGAKAMKTMEKDVRANRALFLPKISPNADMAGTVEVEKVVQKTDGGYWIQTSLPRVENTSVNVNTGMRGTNPMFMSWVYYPEKIFVETTREPKVDERILVRRTGMSYVEITAEEVKDATAMLKD
jgi:hypothetical protein